MEKISIKQAMSVPASGEKQYVDVFTAAGLEYARLQDEQETRKREVERCAIKASKALAAEDYETAGKYIDMVRAGLKVNADERFDTLLQPVDIEALTNSLKEKRTGIPSGIYFTKMGEWEEWLIPCGALTYVAAPTSHGKSRFLQNLALDLACRERGKYVLYFSLEEDSTAVIERMLNIYTDTYLGGNNSKVIRQYFADGVEPTVGASMLKDGWKELSVLLSTGGLRVISHKESPTISNVRELCGIIRRAYDDNPYGVQAIFIDYMQLVRGASTMGKKDELANICEDLMAVSVETGFPIILGAQLNRETSSPISMEITNIADASNIEHSANTVILLWDSAQAPSSKDTSYKSGTMNGAGVTEEAGILESVEHVESSGIRFHFRAGDKVNGISPVRPDGCIDRPWDFGAQYLKLAKCRGMQRNMEAVLLYNGNTFKVYGNKEDMKYQTQKKESERPHNTSNNRKPVQGTRIG